MYVIRILLALILGGLSSIALAHPLAEALRPVLGDQAGFCAALTAPVGVVLAAIAVVLLTYPFKGRGETASRPHRLSDIDFKVDTPVRGSSPLARP